MKVIQTLPQADLNAVPDAARAADEAGFDVLMTMENQHEPFLALAVAAVTTKRAELGPGIAIACVAGCWERSFRAPGVPTQHHTTTLARDCRHIIAVARNWLWVCAQRPHRGRG